MFLCAAGLLLGAKTMWATTPANTFAVGTCRPSLPSYPTISAAVAAAPAGATVLVCPGTYPEQVVITVPLNLQGISSGNSERAVITAGGVALTTVVDAVLDDTIAPQVWVEAGPVNITNITVDGTGNTVPTTEFLVGIFYDSGSSGTVNEVTTRQQTEGGLGSGIMAENGNSSPIASVTIENSSVHDFDNFGILVASNQTPPTLTATVKGNIVRGGGVGINNFGATASVTSNVVAGSFRGITALAATTVTGNTVTDAGQIGIVAAAAGDIIKANTVVNSALAGIYLNASGATVQSNKLAENATGIEFACFTGTVSGNTISDTATGMNDVPLTFSMVNTFENVDTIRSGGSCTSAAGREAAAARAAQLLSPVRPRPN